MLVCHNGSDFDLPFPEARVQASGLGVSLAVAPPGHIADGALLPGQLKGDPSAARTRA